jgi:hypothetical protein
MHLRNTHDPYTTYTHTLLFVCTGQGIGAESGPDTAREARPHGRDRKD